MKACSNSAINKSKERGNAISAFKLPLVADLYSMITDKITVVIIAHLFKVGKEVKMT